MQNNANNPTNRFLISLMIIVLTMIVVQQAINIFFPDEGLIRLFAKLIIDTSLIVTSLIIKNTLVANALLITGFIRYIFIFFQNWNGGSASTKPAVFGFVLLVLIIVAVIKFGHLNGDIKEA